jgi:hypothetical protein
MTFPGRHDDELSDNGRPDSAGWHEPDDALVNPGVRIRLAHLANDVCSSGETFGLPIGLRDRQRQYARNPARCLRMMVFGQSRQGRRGTKPNKQKTIGIVEVPSFRCPPAKHIDLCRRIRISASFALDLKSKVRTPRISLNRSFIRSRTFATR